MSRKALISFALASLLLAVLIFVHTRWQNHGTRRLDSSGPLTARPEPNRRRTHDRSTLAGSEHNVPGSAKAVETSCTSRYFASWEEPAVGSCQIEKKSGYPVPDPRCTPGGINLSISIDVLRSPAWRTRSVRNCETSEKQKHIAYVWYGIGKPRLNSDQNQVCELDHLVPLELGGADGLGNIWPQCGPDAVDLHDRYFKNKDRVESYLADGVKSGRITLQRAQMGIASDWTQYIQSANRWCAVKKRCQ